MWLAGLIALCIKFDFGLSILITSCIAIVADLVSPMSQVSRGTMFVNPIGKLPTSITPQAHWTPLGLWSRKSIMQAPTHIHHKCWLLLICLPLSPSSTFIIILWYISIGDRYHHTSSSIEMSHLNTPVLTYLGTVSCQTCSLLCQELNHLRSVQFPPSTTALAIHQ